MRSFILIVALLLAPTIEPGKWHSRGQDLVKTFLKQQAAAAPMVNNVGQSSLRHYLAIRSAINHSDVSTLEYGMQHFFNCNGFENLIRSIAHQIKCPNGFKGAWYELEAAAKLHQELAPCNNHLCIEFNQIKQSPDCHENREFDVIFLLAEYALWVECKNIKWHRRSKIKKQFLRQKRIVDQHNLMGNPIQHLICSKNKIPNAWMHWFASHGIHAQTT